MVLLLLQLMLQLLAPGKKSSCKAIPTLRERKEVVYEVLQTLSPHTFPLHINNSFSHHPLLLTLVHLTFSTITHFASEFSASDK